MLFIFLCCNSFFPLKNYQKFKNDYDNDLNYDVYLIGGSKTLCGVLPLELYNNYGIMSYNFSASSLTSSMEYFVMKNISNIKKPKLIVYDPSAYYTDFTYNDAVYTLDLFNVVPLSVKKVISLLEICKKNIEWYIFNFFYTHNNYSCYDEYYNDMRNINYYHNQNGADISFFRLYKGEESKPNYVDKTIVNKVTYELNTNLDYNIKYLEKLIEYCKNNDIKLLVAPVPTFDWEQDKIKCIFDRIEEICKNNEIDYYTVSCDKFNNYSDFSDVKHMTPSGALKWTKMLGEYIVKNYNLTDLSNEIKNGYESKVYYYYIWKNNTMCKLDSGKSFLSWLYDNQNKRNYSLYIKKNSKLYNDKQIIELIKNLDDDYDFPLLNSIHEGEIENVEYCLYVDKINNVIYETKSRQEMIDCINSKIIQHKNDFTNFFVGRNIKLSTTDETKISYIDSYDLSIMFTYNDEDNLYPICHYNYDINTGSLNKSYE